MSFDVYGSANKPKTESNVDFDALNNHVIEVAQLQTPETLTGVVSMIVDLGNQERADAEQVVTMTPEQEAEAIAKQPNTYFKDGVDKVTGAKVRLKCWPQKPIQKVVIAVDFPEIIVDKGQFFGESKPLPLRMWLGGKFYMENSGMIVQNPTELKELYREDIKAWSFDKKHLFHKMAVGAKLISPDDIFKPANITDLLGQALQFQAQIFMKAGKNGKSYYTENIKFVGGLGRGAVVPKHNIVPQLIQFRKENDVEALKHLPAHVINTMKRALNWNDDTTVVRKQLESLQGDSPSAVVNNTPVENKPAQQKVVQQVNSQADVDDGFDFDDLVPF
jgi:hypothetical protein